MEGLRGQTHAILRHGLDRPAARCLELFTDPLPVWSHPAAAIDRALEAVHQLRGDASAPTADCCGCRNRRGRGLLEQRPKAPMFRVVASPADGACHRPRSSRAAVLCSFAVGFEPRAGHRLAWPSGWRFGAYHLALLVVHCGSPSAMERWLAAPEGRVSGLPGRWPRLCVMGSEELERSANASACRWWSTGFRAGGPAEEWLWPACGKLERGESGWRTA